MLSAFLGEFLFHPCALEASFYKCTNDCAYCFTNNKAMELRDPQIKGVDSFIRTAYKRRTLNADLFNEGFPVCMSNNSDPFTRQNYRFTEQFTRLLNNFPNGIYFQTKGTYGVDEVLDAIGERRDRLFYITITCTDDKASKTVEPEAPTTRERLELAKTLSEAGFPVIIGFNPYCVKWNPYDELVEMCCELLEYGIRDFFFQPIRLTSRKIQAFTPERVARFSGFSSAEELKEYCEGVEPWKDMIRAIYYVAKILPESRPSSVQTLNSSPFELYKKTFSKTMPTSAEFCAWCLQNPKDEYTFDDFRRVLFADNAEFWERPHGDLDRYILAQARDLWRGRPENQKMTSYTKLLRLMWNNPFKFVCVPGSCYGMKVAGKDEQGNITLQLRDKPSFIESEE